MLTSLQAIKRDMNMLQISKKHLNSNTQKILYYAQTFSHINYGIVVWENMIEKEQLQKVQTLQNKFMELIEPNLTLREYYEKHKILKVHHTIDLENSKLNYKLEHNELPNKLPNSLKPINGAIQLPKPIDIIPDIQIFQTQRHSSTDKASYSKAPQTT